MTDTTTAAGATPATDTTYHILQVRPAGYVHADAVTELAQSTYHALRRLGLAVRNEGPAGPHDVPIVFGGHLLDEAAVASLPANAILYNSEQMTPESPWIGSAYLAALATHRVWDYSQRNVERLRALGVADVRCVPVGYVPELVRIAPANEDIDVLFYGSLNDRRKAVLEELTRRGLKVVHLFGTYGAERDQIIARSKVVLNIHFYASRIFEIVRVSYLLSNYKPVVAECDADTEVDPDIRGAVHAVPYEGLVDACVSLVRDERARRELAARGHNAFCARRATDYLADALGVARPPVASASIPRTLHVGSGKDYRADHFNVDIDPAWGPDAVLDVAERDVVGRTIDTARFGRVTLGEECFDRLIANDVLEHIPDLTAAMGNCLRLLRAGGEFEIVVPYDLSYGAWQDPTHVRAFNERSWLYYTDWYWYLGWTEARFDTVMLEYVPSPLGEELVKSGRSVEEVLRMPRTVDSMRVRLRKRYLQEHERNEARARQPGAQRAARA